MRLNFRGFQRQRVMQPFWSGLSAIWFCGWIVFGNSSIAGSRIYGSFTFGFEFEIRRDTKPHFSATLSYSPQPESVFEMFEHIELIASERGFKAVREARRN